MAAQKKSESAPRIQKITVAGYKSIRDERTIELGGLTILAGANSSGKSSIMQPLLLLKQTLEAPYDPGPLLLNGPNVKFTSAEQMFSGLGTSRAEDLQIGMETSVGSRLRLHFRLKPKQEFQLSQMDILENSRLSSFHLDMPHQEVENALPSIPQAMFKQFVKPDSMVVVFRNRCLIDVKVVTGSSSHFEIALNPAGVFPPHITNIIHLPGLRGTPERTYPITGLETKYPGTFETYTASVLAQWSRYEKDLLDNVSNDLKELGLTWKVEARKLDDTQVEIKVGRTPKPVKYGAKDLVNIADVGFGVSQTLPVVVALHVAKPGQLVYLEQPELHLHPRAQEQLAQILANAVKRGIQVVIETHSSLLLLGIQTLIAEEKLEADAVRLHWFQRPKGVTEIKTANIDADGSFGDWPVDFGEVSLNAQSRYLDAVDARYAKHAHPEN